MTLPTLYPRAPSLFRDNSGQPRFVTGLGARARLRPVILIVAGVSGSGKTTVGALLAGRLRWPFADADTFHPDANVAKMRAGIPLTDEDRWPWLRAIADWMDARITAGQSAVVTCSALKRPYRNLLLCERPEAVMVFLESGREELLRRLSARQGHFFPQQLLDSQLADLEPPEADEHVLTVQDEAGAAWTAAKIIDLLWPLGAPAPEDRPAPGAL
jgi:gluconokinase